MLLRACHVLNAACRGAGNDCETWQMNAFMGPRCCHPPLSLPSPLCHELPVGINKTCINAAHSSAKGEPCTEFQHLQTAFLCGINLLSASHRPELGTLFVVQMATPVGNFRLKPHFLYNKSVLFVLFNGGKAEDFDLTSNH